MIKFNSNKNMKTQLHCYEYQETYNGDTQYERSRQLIQLFVGRATEKSEEEVG
jgi:hypothetical protein